jgi:FKBP-type peptidyl-prolyl cis-trans isomerase
MSPFTKFEAIGIFASVAVMAIALSLIRFKTDAFLTVSDAVPQEAAIVVAGNDESAVRNALTDTVSTDGTLTKLIINDVKKGIGETVENGDTVAVNYIGSLRDGTQFDNSFIRGEPFTFTVGEGKVIEGWEKGILGMQVGGQRILVIPAEEAYGNRQVGPIPPNSPLVFSIELVSIK